MRTRTLGLVSSMCRKAFICMSLRPETGRQVADPFGLANLLSAVIITDPSLLKPVERKETNPFKPQPNFVECLADR